MGCAPVRAFPAVDVFSLWKGLRLKNAISIGILYRGNGVVHAKARERASQAGGLVARAVKEERCVVCVKSTCKESSDDGDNLCLDRRQRYGDPL